MKSLRSIISLFLLFVLPSSLAFAQQQSQVPARTIYTFTPPRSGGTTADLQVTVTIANGGTTVTRCDFISNCTAPNQSANNSYNPFFSTNWNGLTGLVKAAAEMFSNCTTTTCTVSTPFPDGTCAVGTASCSLRLTNAYLNNFNSNTLSASSSFAGAADFGDWADSDMAGSINVTNSSTAIVFNSVDQHCTNTSTCAPTTFACSTAWANKQFFIWDNAAALRRSVTLAASNPCTTLSATYAGTTSAAQRFYGLYDWTVLDAMIASRAINGKKMAVILRGMNSSGINIVTPQYVTGTEAANSLVKTGADASFTLASNKLTFGSGNQVNWAGGITVGGNPYVIDHCVTAGYWSNTSQTCFTTTNCAVTCGAGLSYTYNPQPVEVCWAVSYAGGNPGSFWSAGPGATTTCRNTQTGAAPVQVATNASGVPVYYSLAYQTFWQAWVAATLAHLNNNLSVAYIRTPLSAGGENFPWACCVGSGMFVIAPSATITDPPFTRFQYLTALDALNVAIDGVGVTSFQVDISGNHSPGPGQANDYTLADWAFSYSLFHGRQGFGSQGAALSDLTAAYGLPCSGNWCKNFIVIKRCQPPTNPGVVCASTIKSGFLLQLQQAGNDDPFNNFFGPGTSNPPLSAARSLGVTTITFTSDPTGSLVRTDGTGSITVANWPDPSFNTIGSVISNASSGAKTISYLQPGLPDTTSVALVNSTWVATGQAIPWPMSGPFLTANGVTDVELYVDPSLMVSADPTIDTYHGFIKNSTIYNNRTYGQIYSKWVSDFVSSAWQ